MRILALVPSLYDTSPGQRFRIEQWEPLLTERGVQITYRSFESKQLHEVLYQRGKVGRKLLLILRAFARRFLTLATVRNYDAVYVFREAALLGPALIETLIYKSGVPMIFDFDDAVFVPYVSPSNSYLSYLKFPSKTRTTCRLSAHVMAGNAYLADYAREVNNQVTVIPTTIDTRKYLPPPRKTHGSAVYRGAGHRLERQLQYGTAP